MLFNSLGFALFFPAVLGLYWALPRRLQNPVLLVASYAFYAAWDWRFLSLLLGSTVADYLIGRALGKTRPEAVRKRLLAASAAVNLGILGGFKYYGFFVGSAAGVLRAIGFEPHMAVLQVVLPVGISFYTFQTMSYTFDVYRRRIQPARDPLTFAVYVSFFPQLVAGPIERARRLLPQLQAPREWPGRDKARSALFLIFLGLFKKIVVADPVGEIVDHAFSAGSAANSATLLLGIFAFGLQVYGDFSGYTDIARGTSRLFGIELMRNFEQPYLSRNITEFWRTWHISLSTWLHDYLYVPLGGNKGGKVLTYRNLMLTMVLGGLWHGAAWTYVAWGALHGVYLSFHRRFGSYVPRDRPAAVSVSDVPAIVTTFVAISLLWPFFRAASIGDSIDYLYGLLRLTPGLPDLDHLVVLVVAAAAVLLIDVAQRNSGRHVVVVHWRPAARGMAYATMGLSILVWLGGQAQPFIYFQF